MERYKLVNGILRLNDQLAVPTGKLSLILYNVKTQKVIEDLVDNMFVTAGKNSLADALRGTTANNKGIITYFSVGTSTQAPALGDTSLIAEIFRKLVSVRSVSGNIATFQTFLTTSEGNGTLREAGLFGDAATGSANTGTLYCRAAINRVKSSSDTLTATWNVTIG